jgi:hypothetical protein
LKVAASGKSLHVLGLGLEHFSEEEKSVGFPQFEFELGEGSTTGGILSKQNLLGYKVNSMVSKS